MAIPSFQINRNEHKGHTGFTKKKIFVLFAISLHPLRLSVFPCQALTHYGNLYFYQDMPHVIGNYP